MENRYVLLAEALMFVRDVGTLALKLPKQYREIALANLELKLGLFPLNKNLSWLASPINKIIDQLNGARASQSISKNSYDKIYDSAINLVESLHSIN